MCVRWQGGAPNKCDSCFRKKKPSRQITAPYFISKDVALISFPEPMLGAVFEAPPPPPTPHDGCLCRSSASDGASYYGDAGDKHDRRRLRDAGAVRAAPRVIIVTFAAGGGGRPYVRTGFGDRSGWKMSLFVLLSEIMKEACDNPPPGLSCTGFWGLLVRATCVRRDN